MRVDIHYNLYININIRLKHQLERQHTLFHSPLETKGWPITLATVKSSSPTCYNWEFGSLKTSIRMTLYSLPHAHSIPTPHNMHMCSELVASRLMQHSAGAFLVTTPFWKCSFKPPLTAHSHTPQTLTVTHNSSRCTTLMHTYTNINISIASFTVKIICSILFPLAYKSKPAPHPPAFPLILATLFQTHLLSWQT